jgi:hypothetical protein
MAAVNAHDVRDADNLDSNTPMEEEVVEQKAKAEK